MTFVMTIAVLKVALSWMPLTRMTVTIAVMRMAGKSSRVPVALSMPVAGLKSKGALPSHFGK